MGAVPSPSPDDHVQIGTVIDNRYRVEAVIGVGGMGRVYRAEHTALGRSVAIKVLHSDLGRNREATTRFQREALASGRLDHLNIVGVMDFGVLDDGAAFLVMEALEGEALGTRLERERVIPWHEALTILRGVLAGLRHAHDRGVVHRDIKPDNIFLARKDGEQVIKILDFGIAKLYAGSPDDPATTRAGLTVGTPAYLSPEQAVGGEISPACDLYSTTVVLFEMLTGRTPFESKDPLAMLTSHVTKTPPRLAEVATSALPPGLDELVARGLAKMPVDRISSASEYLAAVEEILGVQRTPPSQPMIPVPRPPEASAPVSTPPASDSAAPDEAMARIASAPHPLLGRISIKATPLSMPAVTVTVNDHDRTTTYTPPPSTDPAAPVSTSIPAATASPTRAVSLAGTEQEPIPRRWLYISAAVLVVAAIAAIYFAITSHAHEPTTATPPSSIDEPNKDPRTDEPTVEPKKAEPGKPSKPHGEATPPEPPPAEVTVAPTPAPTGESAEAEAKYQTAMTEFVKGRGCKDRKAGFDILAAIDDPRVLPAVKKWGHRYHDKYLGLSHDDYNACFSDDVDALIKKLEPPTK